MGGQKKIVFHMSDGRDIVIAEWENVKGLRDMLADNAWIHVGQATIMVAHIVWMEEK